MNPNGQNQRWSRWTFTITKSGTGISGRTRKEIVLNVNNFLKKLFGTAGAFQLISEHGKLVIEVLVEDLDITPQDPFYVNYIDGMAKAFFVAGFGADTEVITEAKLVAGSAQTGAPAEQLLILPTIHCSIGGQYGKRSLSHWDAEAAQQGA